MSFRLQMFLISALAGILLVGVAYMGLRSIDRLAYSLERIDVTGSAMRNHLDGDMMHDAIRGDVQGAVAATTDEERETALKDLEVHAKRFRECVAENQKKELDPTIATALAAVAPKLEAYIASGEQMVKTHLKDPAAAKALKPDFDKSFAAMEVAQAELTDQIEVLVHNVHEVAIGEIPSGRIIITSGLCIGLVVLFLASFLISRRLINQINQCQGAAATMASGDLSQRLNMKSRDETGRLAAGLDQALVALCDSMSRVQQETEHIRGVSTELTGISKTLVEGSSLTSNEANGAAKAASQITGEVQTVAASLEEFSASSREVAANASKAASVASEAVRLGEAASTSMNSLKAASESIGTVVRTVTDIAEQTNLLALNASIEAARAGESGKGFAVVAGEVKELARQSAAATTRISAEVERIQTEVKRTVAALESMGATIRTINDIQAGTAAAAEEQHSTITEVSVAVQRAAAGSGDIATAVNRVASAAGQSASGAVQISEAANRLNALAEQMRVQLGRFKVS